MSLQSNTKYLSAPDGRILRFFTNIDNPNIPNEVRREKYGFYPENEYVIFRYLGERGVVTFPEAYARHMNDAPDDTMLAVYVDNSIEPEAIWGLRDSLIEQEPRLSGVKQEPVPATRIAEVLDECLSNSGLDTSSPAPAQPTELDLNALMRQMRDKLK